jgi:two-component sensor histidine kinase
VRNIMAVIRSIASRTAHNARSVDEYARVLEGRLLAIARVQALLTRQANVGVDIHEVVRDELLAQASHSGQFVMEGPDVTLSPKTTEVLTLAIHELTTNAVKYGALSVVTGKIQARWSVEERGGEPWLVFDWVETGGPELPEAPGGSARRRGFGTELIEKRIPYELGGSAAVTIAAVGAHCHITFPLKHLASVLETDAPDRLGVKGT